MSDMTFATGYVPGCIGRVAELHGTYYSRHWGFGLDFEAKVATELVGFLKRYDSRRDGLWTIRLNDRIEGSIVIDGARPGEASAHLRWFIVSEPLQGQGLGRRLLDEAVGFCRNAGSPGIHLWTFEGLQAARHLYEAFGFELVWEQRGSGWGTEVAEQRFECALS